MTPREKARELYYGFYSISDEKTGKKSAVICVECIIDALATADTNYDLLPALDYYAEVKQEVEKI